MWYQLKGGLIHQECNLPPDGSAWGGSKSFLPNQVSSTPSMEVITVPKVDLKCIMPHWSELTQRECMPVLNRFGQTNGTDGPNDMALTNCNMITTIVGWSIKNEMSALNMTGGGNTTEKLGDMGHPNWDKRSTKVVTVSHWECGV